MKNILLDFWSFIKKPKDEQYSGTDKKYKWKVLFTLFACELLLLVFYFPLTSFIEKFVVLEESFDENYTIVMSLFLYVLLIPFFEELFFRYFLRRTGIINYIFNEKTWNKLYPFFFYTSVFAFGLVHITNFSYTSVWIYILAPLLVLTQIVGGFVMSYLRVRFSFSLGFMYHALWNLTALFIIDGSYYLLNIDKVEIKNNSYELTIEPKQFLPLNPSTLYYNIKNDTVFALKAEAKSTHEVIKIVSPLSNNYIKTSTLVELHFNSEKGIHKDSLLNILETEGYIEKKTSTN